MVMLSSQDSRGASFANEPTRFSMKNGTGLFRSFKEQHGQDDKKIVTEQPSAHPKR